MEHLQHHGVTLGVQLEELRVTSADRSSMVNL